MFTKLPEITNLFAKLASQLQQTLTPPSQDDQQDCDYLISKLNRSLNLDQNDDSRVRVLDTALSLMCFKSPQVYDSVIQYMVKTIVTVLSSSVSSRVQKDEILQIGSSFACCDCDELVDACTNVVRKLEPYGEFSHSLLDAVVRVLVSASCYQYAYPSMFVYDEKSVDAKNVAVSKLLRHLPKATSYTPNKDEIPLRLQLWYLDPLNLKHDVSKILQECIKWPFLCLNKELYERMDWRSVIICLVLSPTMFIETRALLHNWFLVTGLASVLQLLITLVSIVLDVLSRPTWWGISLEMGSKLQFSNAYFPHKYQLLRILNVPLLSEAFLHIVDIISEQFSLVTDQLDPDSEQAARKAAMIGHNSSWALAMNFPEWFYFASMLLFSEKSFQNDLNSKCAFGASKSEEAGEVKSPVSEAAARYIAWILSPLNQSHQDLLFNFLIKISESWTRKQNTDTCNKGKIRFKKKLKKPRFDEKEDDCQIILYWLKQFQDINIHLSLKRNVLLRKFPLGILIGSPNSISEDGCDLLLQYAATGIIPNSKKTEYNMQDTTAGVYLVFDLTDIIEKMSDSIFETEKRALDFICLLKIKMVKYLTKCIHRLLQLEIDEEDGAQMLLHLCNRLVHWRVQGRDCFEGNKDLDDVVVALNNKLSSLLVDFE